MKLTTTIFLFLHLVAIGKVEGEGALFVQFVNYSNPSGEGSNGNCCDGLKDLVCQADGCDMYYEICVTDNSDVDTGCRDSSHKIKTGRKNNKDSLEFSGVIGGDTLNPMVFRFDDYMSKSQYMRVKVRDWDRFNNDDHVDTLEAQLRFNTNPGAAHQPSSMRIVARTTLEVLVWVECQAHYYTCVSCDSFCSIFCYLEGANPHGYCNEVGEIICYEDWTGDQCEEPVTTTTSTTTTTTTRPTTTTTTPTTTTTTPTTTTEPGPTVVTDENNGITEISTATHKYYLLPYTLSKWSAEQYCNLLLDSNVAYLARIDNDQLAKVIGDALIGAGIRKEFWIDGYSWGSHHQIIGSIQEEVSSAGARCVILSSWAEPGNPGSNLEGDSYSAFTKNCEHPVEATLCETTN